MKAYLLVLAFVACIVSEVQAIYFYLERGQEKCFKDEVVKNYVSAFRKLTFE